MAALSDYLESGLLNHLFRNQAFERPETIAVALTSDVPTDSQSGLTIPEIPSGVLAGSQFVTTGYSRINLGDPSVDGDSTWNNIGVDTSTVYEVYSEIPTHTGYFYPLYLDADTASNVEGSNGLYDTYSFEELFPGVEFYSPMVDGAASGAAESAGYTLYEGNGFIRNKNDLVFGVALREWGWVSGVAILDHAGYGSGNMLMYAQLENPRYIYIGDTIKFNANSLEISLK